MAEAPPETAIAAFERATGLQVVLRAPDDHRAAGFPPSRFLHHAPVCAAVKASARERCLAGYRATVAPALVEGRALVHRCHAGLVQWVCGIPVEGGWWHLYAGQRRAGRDLRPDLADRIAQGPWTPAVATLPEVDAATAAWIAELLAQLAARLAWWLARQPRTAAAPAARDERIRRFVHEFHQKPLRLADLAEHLGVSPARAGNAVREACGRSFRDLLTEERLRAARRLLAATALPVAAVARSAGFPDPARFHRLFRCRCGLTPAAFRRQGG